MSEHERDTAARYARSLEIHHQIEDLYERVEERRAYLRGLMRVDPGVPRVPGVTGGVTLDPVVCSLAVKAATTKRVTAITHWL